MAQRPAPASPERPPEILASPEAPEVASVAETQAEAESAAAVWRETPQAEAPEVTVPSAAPAAPAALHKDPIMAQIESVLEDNVFEAYAAMGPAERQVFKARGEQVASQIQEAIAKGKVQLKRLWEWIRDWLRLIPGVSQFFVEQEAKIKADRIYFLIQKQKSSV